MKQKKIKKLVMAMFMACFSFGVLLCPATSLSAEAAVAETVQPRSDIIEWRFKIEDGKLYRRLYNYSTANWIGEWLYVGEYPG